MDSWWNILKIVLQVLVKTESQYATDINRFLRCDGVSFKITAHYLGDLSA
jgi:hypothetical protein